MTQILNNDLLLPDSGDTFLIEARMFQHLHECFSGGIFVNSTEEIAEVWSVGGNQLGIRPDHGKLPVSADEQRNMTSSFIQKDNLHKYCFAAEH